MAHCNEEDVHIKPLEKRDQSYEWIYAGIGGGRKREIMSFHANGDHEQWSSRTLSGRSI
jgi:hypothetical protein